MRTLMYSKTGTDSVSPLDIVANTRHCAYSKQTKYVHVIVEKYESYEQLTWPHQYADTLLIVRVMRLTRDPFLIEHIKYSIQFKWVLKHIAIHFSRSTITEGTSMWMQWMRVRRALNVYSHASVNTRIESSINSNNVKVVDSIYWLYNGNLYTLGHRQFVSPINEVVDSFKIFHIHHLLSSLGCCSYTIKTITIINPHE